MNKELQLLGEVILNKKKEIAIEVHEDRFSSVPLTEEQKREVKRVEKQIIDIRANFISLFGAALIEGLDQQGTIEKIEKWGKDNGEYFFNMGVPLDEALKDTSYYRKYIWKTVQKEALSLDLSASVIFDVISIIDPLLDLAVYYFSLTYVEFHQKTLENAKSAFLELSVPVVPLTKEVGVLPLIGNIDTERAHLIMEETLKQSGNLKLTHLILDVSGVLIVDTMVADQLFKVIDALSLIGVKTIITGVRPEVAQTMVALGVKIDHLTVKANLHQAFKEIQSI